MRLASSCSCENAHPGLRGIGTVIRCVLIIVALSVCALTFAQKVRILEMETTQADGGNFIITGTVEASGLNPRGQIPWSDYVRIYVDIMNAPDAVYGILPDRLMRVLGPDGRYTHVYTKGGIPLTGKQVSGTDVRRWGLHPPDGVVGFHMRDHPVWRVYGGITDWVKNAPSSATHPFWGQIPLSEKGKRYRIRAELDHRWVEEMRPDIEWWQHTVEHSFFHYIADTGRFGLFDEPEDHAITITQPPSGKPNPVEFNETPDKLEIPVFCTIGARDNEGHAVRYEWECTEGQFDDPTKKDPIWTQPETFESYMKTGYNLGITCKVTCTEDARVSATASYIQKVSGAQMISGTYHRVYLEADPASKAVDFGSNVEEPWAGLFVMITGPDGKQTSATTDANGSFQANVDAPGTYRVEVEDPNIFSREYVVDVTVPNGQLGLQHITDDWRMYTFARVASGYKMVQAQGMLQGGGDYNEVNGLGNVDIYSKLDWNKFLHSSSTKLLQQWKTKKWKYVAPGRNHGRVGAGLLNAISNAIDNSLNSTPAPSKPPKLVTVGGSVQFRDNGAFLQRSLKYGESVDCGHGRFVQNSTVLYCRDDLGVIVYVLEGLVFEYAPGNPRPIAGAITDYKITHDVGVLPPRVERFEWAEAEAVWATGQRPGGGSTPDVPIDGSVLKLSPVMDAYVYEYTYLNWNRANFGKVSTMTAGYHPQGGEKRVYMRFELPALGSVKRATLKLYQYYFAGKHVHRLGVHRVLSPWREGDGVAHRGQSEPTGRPGEISWADQPAFDATPVIIFMPPDDPDEWVEVDITALVNSWLAGQANHGLMLKVAALSKPNRPNSWYGFYSREYEEQDKRPVLELTPNGTVPSVPTPPPVVGPTPPPVVGPKPPPGNDPDTTDLPPLLSDPVIRRAAVCEGVDAKHQPILRTSFPADTQRIGIYLEWANAAPNTQVRIQWYRDGKALWDSRMVAEGTRKAVSYLRSGKSGTPLQSGRYQAQIFRGNTPVANLPFTIGVTR